MFYHGPYLPLVTYVLAQSNMKWHDVEWRSTFYYLPTNSIWLHTFGYIYYRLFSIKYKYHVVAILYLQSCVRLLLDQIQFLLIFCLVWALRSHLTPWSLYHWNLASTESWLCSRQALRSRPALDKMVELHLTAIAHCSHPSESPLLDKEDIPHNESTRMKTAKQMGPSNNGGNLTLPPHHPWNL